MDEDSRARILVVDDDQGMVSTLRDILEVSGYDVDVAHSGTEAIERVRDRRPDCVLMDIRMPGLNGVETWREIQRMSPRSSVIFITAYSESQLAGEAEAEGELESKPLDLERLLAMLRRAVERAPGRGASAGDTEVSETDG